MELRENGFIKVAAKTFEISPKDRVVLIRKGNEFYNSGRMDDARKVFITIKYTDGLIRLGDYYYKNNDFIEAMQMYMISKDKVKISMIADEFAQNIRKWIKE